MPKLDNRITLKALTHIPVLVGFVAHFLPLLRLLGWESPDREIPLSVADSQEIVPFVAVVPPGKD